MLNAYYDEESEKVDHHETLNANGDIGSNSKDTLDSVCGCVQSMYEAVTEDIDGVMNPKIISSSAWEERIDEYSNALQLAQLQREFQYKIRMQLGRRH